MIGHRFGDVLGAEGKLDLPQVARVGAQQGDLPPAEAGADQQLVEGVALGLAEPDAGEGILEFVLHLVHDDIVGEAVDQAELLYPVTLAVAGAHPVGTLGDHAQAQVLQDRQHVGQGQAVAAVVKAQPQLVALLLHQPVEAHGQFVAIHEPQDLLDIQYGDPRVEVVPVARREALAQFAHVLLAVLLAELLQQAQVQAVLPVQGGLHDLALDLRGIELQRHRRIDPQYEVAAHQDRFREVGGELRFLGVEGVRQDALDLLTLLGGITIPRNVDDAIDEFAVHVLADEQAGLPTFLDAIDCSDGFVEVADTGLKQFVPGKPLQHPDQFAGLVLGPVEIRHLHDGLHLAPQNGYQARVHVVDRSGVEPDEAVLSHQRTLLVEDAHFHVIGIGEAMDAGALPGFGEAQLLLVHLLH